MVRGKDPVALQRVQHVDVADPEFERLIAVDELVAVGVEDEPDYRGVAGLIVYVRVDVPREAPEIATERESLVVYVVVRHPQPQGLTERQRHREARREGLRLQGICPRPMPIRRRQSSSSGAQGDGASSALISSSGSPDMKRSY